MARLLLSVQDLSDEDIDDLLGSAAILDAGGAATGQALLGSVVPRAERTDVVVGILMLEPSLRTRVGFAVASARIGASTVVVDERRDGLGQSSPESFDDTVRVMAGMVDILVVRAPVPFDRRTLRALDCAAVVSGGEGGPTGEHPTQALIDVAAIESELGSLRELHVAISGDLNMRVARSLLRILARRPPRRLSLMAPPGRDDPGIDVPAVLRSRTVRSDPNDVGDVDVLYLCGLPEGRGPEQLDTGQRRPWAATAERMQLLPADAIVLSPMPVIDEVDPSVWSDRRIRILEQSDRGMSVRMAVLDHLLGPS